MATLVRALSLAAEQATFSCNDRALWKFFSVRQLFWAVSKSYEREGEINKKYGQYIENTSWKLRAYDIYARVFDVSEIAQVSAANEWDF